MPQLNYNVRICISQVACDGNRVQGKDATCYHCKRRIAARARPTPPLKGERTELTKGEKYERGLI